MTALAPSLEAFFTDRLAQQRRASAHTVAAYRDSFRLLLDYLQRRTGTAPSRLQFEDLDAEVITAFLVHLENDRANSIRTRNARLAALHSFFRFAALRHPEHAWLIQRVLAIPPKRAGKSIVAFLTDAEVEALLAAPDRTTRNGRRDHALLVLALQTGLRVSELTGLCCGDVKLGTGAHVRTCGKGRKDRCTPLIAQTAAVLGAWMREQDRQPTDRVFPGRGDGTLSSDAVQRMIAKHTATAAMRCPTLRGKRVAPHVLRHTAAMTLLAAGVDQTVIALWLGHERVETTDIYIHGDLTIKERAIARTAPPGTRPGRYKAPDALLAFLEAL
jgi:site-specific recombinase XerD